MPYKVVKKSGPKPYKIVNKQTGKVVGSSASKSAAQSSVRARMGAHHGWKPTGKKRSK